LAEELKPRGQHISGLARVFAVKHAHPQGDSGVARVIHGPIQSVAIQYGQLGPPGNFEGGLPGHERRDPLRLAARIGKFAQGILAGGNLHTGDIPADPISRLRYHDIGLVKGTLVQAFQPPYGSGYQKEDD
jgi:hypothetical protein